jgi:hypothetical protein
MTGTSASGRAHRHIAINQARRNVLLWPSPGIRRAPVADASPALAVGADVEPADATRRWFTGLLPKDHERAEITRRFGSNQAHISTCSASWDAPARSLQSWKEQRLWWDRSAR